MCALDLKNQKRYAKIAVLKSMKNDYRYTG